MNLDSGPIHNGDANVAALGPDGRTFPAQGAVIIPVANGGNTNGVWHQYYVIQNSAGNGPIKWSIVDMTLNSGKGEVLAASANTTLDADVAVTEFPVQEPELPLTLPTTSPVKSPKTSPVKGPVNPVAVSIPVPAL